MGIGLGNCCCGGGAECKCIQCADNLHYCDLIVSIPANTFTGLDKTTEEMEADFSWYCGELNGRSIQCTKVAGTTSCAWWGTGCAWDGELFQDRAFPVYVLSGGDGGYTKIQMLKVGSNYICRVEFGRWVSSTFYAMNTFEHDFGTEKPDCIAEFKAGVECEWFSNHVNWRGCEVDEVTPATINVKADTGSPAGLQQFTSGYFDVQDVSYKPYFYDGEWYHAQHGLSNDYFRHALPPVIWATIDGLTNDPCTDCEEVFNGTRFRCYDTGSASNFGNRWIWNQPTDGGDVICAGGMSINKIIVDYAPVFDVYPWLDAWWKVYFYSGSTVIYKAEKKVCDTCIHYTDDSQTTYTFHDWAGETSDWTWTEVTPGSNECDWSAATLSILPQKSQHPCIYHDVLCLCDGPQGDIEATPRYIEVEIDDHWTADGECDEGTENCSLAVGTFFLSPKFGGGTCFWEYQFNDPGCTGYLRCCWTRLYMQMTDTGTKISCRLVLEGHDHIVSWIKEYDYKYVGGINVIDCLDIDDDFDYYCQGGYVDGVCRWDNDPTNLSCGAIPRSGGPWNTIHVKALAELP